MAVGWAAGSAVSVGGWSLDAETGNLLINGGFETAASELTALPSDWSLHTGTTSECSLTTLGSQQITLTTGTTGAWYLQSGTKVTGEIPWDASTGEVQSALRALPGRGGVTVSSSASNIWTVSLVGVGPNESLLTVIDHTDGSFGLVDTSPDSRRARGGRALDISGTIERGQQVVGLQASTAYCLSAWVGTAGATGTLEIELADGLGGSASVLTDADGNACRLSIDVSTAGATATGYGAIIHTPATLPEVVYCRIKITAPSAAIALDEVLLQTATPLYADGPHIAAVQGPTDWAAEDTATVTITNDRAGQLLEWTHRFLGLDQLGVDLPSVTSPGETQSDSLIG